MKKILIAGLCLMMLTSVLSAELTEAELQARAQKAVQNIRNSFPVQKQVQTGPEEVLNKPHSPKMMREKNMWKQTVELGEISRVRSSPKLLLEFSVQINGADTAMFVIGQDVTVTVTSNRPLALMIYVDNGDEVFGFDDLNAFAHMEMGGEEFYFMVEDGDENDMSPPGDGKWEITVPTNFEGDGPLWSLQNTIVYILAVDVDTEIMDMAVAYAAGPVGASSFITGTVYNGDVGAANVLIAAFPGSMDEPGNAKEDPMDIILLAKTDLNGQYSLAVPKELEEQLAGPWTVIAMDIWMLYGGFFADPFFQTVAVPGNSVADFILAEATHTISGVITSTSGVPVSGITLYAYNGFMGIAATTDVTGYYEFLVMPGWYEFEFSESDLAGQYLIPYWGQYNVEVMETNEVLDIQLHPVYFEDAITGTVGFSRKLNLTDLLVIADKWPAGYSIAPVDEFGNYAIPVSSALDSFYVEEGWTSYGYYVWVASNSWDDPVTIPDHYSEVFSGSSGIDFTIINTDAVLYGTVTNEYGWPLNDVEIHVSSSDGTFDAWKWTWDGGNYKFDLIGDKIYILEAWYPGYWNMPARMDTLYIPPQGNVQYDFSVSPPEQPHIFISGYVYDNATFAPLPGANVVIIDQTGLTRHFVTYEDGWFIFDDLTRYTQYDLTVQFEGYTTYYDYIWINDKPVVDYTIYLNPISDMAWINGFVTDGTNPLPNAIVWHYDEYGEHFIWTDSNGSFGLWVPLGGLELKAGTNGFNAGYFNYNITQDTDIELVLTPANLTESVNARVADPNDAGIFDVFIYWESETYIGHTQSNENGSYAIALLPGEYWVQAEHWDYNTVNFMWTVPDPENSYNIVMYSGFEIYGPRALSVADVPEDHGGKVILSWQSNESMDMMGVEAFVVLMSEQNPEAPGFTGWIHFPGNVFRAIPEMMDYQAVVPVLHNDLLTYYRVVGVSYYQAWTSNVVSGMAHDNLPPVVPTGLGIVELDGKPQIFWNPVEMEPIQYYSVYRSVNSGDFALLDHTVELQYTDEDMIPGNTYIYSVTATDYAANESDLSENVSFHITSVSDNMIPEKYALKQNYPNPFNPVTTISFDLPQPENVSLVIYDILGNRVNELFTGDLNAGSYNFVWNATNARGNSVSSGVYIYKLTAGKFSAYQKMILLR
jgi:hypothetical protein